MVPDAFLGDTPRAGEASAHAQCSGIDDDEGVAVDAFALEDGAVLPLARMNGFEVV